MNNNKNKVKRFVTGIDESGQSKIINEGIVDNYIYPLTGNKDLALINLWRLHSVPAKISYLEHMDQAQFSLAPENNGINFRFVDFPPDENYLATFKSSHIDKAWEELKTTQEQLTSKTPHPFMHRTHTIDFGIVLQGEIYLILDQEERLVKEGEVVIQRATNHSWSNRSSKLCRMAFILIDAKE